MLTRNFLTVFALYRVSLDTVSAKRFTDGLKPCSKKSEDVNKCLQNFIDQAKLVLMEGDKELDLPSLDPVNIPVVPIIHDARDFMVDGELKELCATGASDITTTEFDAYMVEEFWVMTLDIPLLTFITDYKMNITLKALKLPVSGSGTCKGKIVKSTLKFLGHTKVTKDNRLELTDLKIKLTIGDVEMSIVRSDNEAVAEAVTEFFNTNKRAVLDLVTPIAENTITRLIMFHFNKILSTVQVTDILVE